MTFDAPTDEVTVAFEGNKDIPFYTHIKGKHQWLPNGNLLVTESVQGRAFELNPQGEIVWEYINYLLPDFVGSVTEVTRLPASYSDLYLEPGLK